MERTPIPPSRISWSGGMGVRSMLRSEEHTSELQSQSNLVCRLLLEKKKGARADATDVARAQPHAARDLVADRRDCSRHNCIAERAGASEVQPQALAVPVVMRCPLLPSAD